MQMYTPTTEEIRGAYHAWSDGQADDHKRKPTWSKAEFDRWFASEIEKAERRGEILATARRIASENAELMRRLS